MNWYPIKLSFHERSYAFGERLIPELLGKRGTSEGVVAETWEISDHGETTGTVLNGELAGRTLHDITMEYPDELVGQGWRGPHFPLLAKFLDASHMLPVHLHADDETAARVYNAPNGKSEAWHIIWAGEGASILAGIKPGVTLEQMVAAWKAEDYDAVMPRFPILPGDTVYVPGGIIHAFGPDTLIYEIQQTSDLGQSVMPTDHYGNRLSDEEWDAAIERTMAELKTDYQPKPNPGIAFTLDSARMTYGAVCEHFAIERWHLSGPFTYEGYPRRCMLLSNVGAPVTLRYPGGEEMLGRAESCILPAALAACELIPGEGADPGDLIVSYVPDREDDVLKPLRAAGHSDEAIATLGEVFD